MSIDRGVLDQQLQTLGDASRWWDKRELRDLPAVLAPDERVLAIARGKVARVRVLRRAWLIVVTDCRLICMRSNRSSWRQIEIPARHINRVALRVGPFRGRVRILSNGQKYALLVPRADAYKLHSALLQIAVPGQENLSGFGPVRMAQRIVDHVLALPAVALDPNASSPAVAGSQRSLPSPKGPPPEPDPRIHELEDQIQQLKDQVQFMEELLGDRRP